MRRLYVLCAVGLLLVTCKTGVAADFSKKIPVGGSYADVLNTWGEPSEKVEEGVLHQTIWYYKDGAKVVFKHGRVRSFRPTNAIVAQQAEMEKLRAQVEPVGDDISGEAADLVRDIAKEVPSGADAPYSEPRSAAEPPIVPNQIPAGGRGQAPAIIPADEMSDDDELLD